MGKILEFPTDKPPGPFGPTIAVREYLFENKCSAVISARIPKELKRYLVAEAFISDARFSEHIARILATHAERQDLHRLQIAS